MIGKVAEAGNASSSEYLLDVSRPCLSRQLSLTISTAIPQGKWTSTSHKQATKQSTRVTNAHARLGGVPGVCVSERVNHAQPEAGGVGAARRVLEQGRRRNRRVAELLERVRAVRDARGEGV